MMNLRSVVLIIFVLTLTIPSAFARTVGGVVIPDTVVLKDGSTLRLNGAGVRSKLFFKIYAAGLYLPESASSPQQVINMPGAKRILMHFIYDGVSKQKLVDAWNEGFQNNLSPSELNALADDIKQFNNVFSEKKKDDQVAIDYLPESGTQVWINGERKLTLANKAFYSALLKIWLGDKPADDDLKEELLGD